MQNYLVSIITVTFNSGNTLERTIKSVIEQDYPSIEYIIVDGGSTDSSVEIIKKYDERINKWISEPDRGAMDAINKAIRIVSGDIIAMVSSDDTLEPNIISSVLKIFNESPHTEVVYGNLRYFDLQRKEILICAPFRKTTDEIYKNIYKWPAVYLNAFFAKRSVYNNLNLSDISGNIANDYELYLKILRNKAKFFYLNKVFVNHQSGGVSCRSFKGYFEIKDIAIKYGCNRITAHYYLFLKILERIADNLLVICGLKKIRSFYAKLFYPNIIIMQNKKDMDLFFKLN